MEQARLPADDLDLERRLEDLVERKVAERLGALEERLQASMERALAARPSPPSDRCTLVVFSGDLDRAMSAMMIAAGAAAMGMEVSMYFTFWAVPLLKTRTIFSGKTLTEKMFSLMLPTGTENLPSSNMNMLGLGPMMLKSIMKKHNVETLASLFEICRELGVRIVACEVTMGLMGIVREELTEGLDYGGVATYLGDAADSRVTLFI